TSAAPSRGSKQLKKAAPLPGKFRAFLDSSGDECYHRAECWPPKNRTQWAQTNRNVLSMNLDIGARLCAQHQPQHAGNIQSAAAGSSTSAALQEIRPGSWSQ